MQKFPRSQFGTFWYGGRLSAFEYVCLLSIMKQGHKLTLFSYSPVENLPDGIVNADASSIVPKIYTKNFLISGQPHLGHFSDYFRYRMIEICDFIWIDADMFFLNSDFDGSNAPDVLSYEHGGGLNGAILYLHNPSVLQEILSITESKQNKDLRWGETGPLLLDKLFKRRPPSGTKIYQPETFYPISHHDQWRIFLPSERKHCEELCKNSVSIHLYNNLLTKMGYWKEIAPPNNSYLHSLLHQYGYLKYFKDEYPADCIQNLVKNYLLRLNGQDLGIKTAIKQLIPSIHRSYKNYMR